MLDELEQAAKAVLASAGGLVVQIGRGGRGSGLVIGPGLVLTNAHNLRDRTTTVTATGGNGVQGTAAGVDLDGDLAVVRVEGEAGQSLVGADPAGLRWRDEPIDAGTPVFTLTGGPSGARISFGLVAAAGREFRGPRGRRISGSLEHTAPLPRGASGGPVLDAAGRLVGINTHRMGHGSYLAVPADATLRQRVEALIRGERPAHRRLGVVLAPSAVGKELRRRVGLPERDGLLVRGVVPGGAADRVGLREGDLLIAADDRPLTSIDELHEALDGNAPELRLAVVRGVEDLNLIVRFTPEETSTEPATGPSAGPATDTAPTTGTDATGPADPAAGTNPAAGTGPVSET
jgi:serine protease Do